MSDSAVQRWRGAGAAPADLAETVRPGEASLNGAAAQRAAAASQIERTLRVWRKAAGEEPAVAGEGDGGGDAKAEAEGEAAAPDAKEPDAADAAAVQDAPPVAAKAIQRKVFLGRGDKETLEQKKGLQAQIANCTTCIKVLEQYERLAAKYKVVLPPARLTALDARRDNGTITGDDVPATLREVYGLDTKLTLAEIRTMKSAAEKDLKALK